MTDRASAEGLRAAAQAAFDSGEIDHALHYDPSCEECVYLARPVVVHSDSGDIDMERLAAILARSIAFPDDGTLARQEAERIAREYARASTPEGEK